MSTDGRFWVSEQVRVLPRGSVYVAQCVCGWEAVRQLEGYAISAGKRHDCTRGDT